EPALRYLTEIVHRRPGQWLGEVDRLHEVLQRHGPEVLRRAMAEGLKEEIFSAAYVESFLQHSLLFQEAVPLRDTTAAFPQRCSPFSPASVRGEHRPDSGGSGLGYEVAPRSFFPRR